MTRLGDLLADAELIDTATVTVAAINASLTSALMVCAGHPPAILLGADGRTRLIEEAHGRMLGYPGGRHEAVSIPIAAGDTLVLYTDGLVERRGETIDEGIERLRGVVAGTAGTDVVERAFAALVPRGAGRRRGDSRRPSPRAPTPSSGIPVDAERSEPERLGMAALRLCIWGVGGSQVVPWRQSREVISRSPLSTRGRRRNCRARTPAPRRAASS